MTEVVATQPPTSDSQLSWKDHLILAAKVGAAYGGRMFVGLALGLVVSLTIGIVLCFRSVSWIYTHPMGGIAGLPHAGGGAAAALAALVLAAAYWRIVLSAAALGILFPVLHFALTQAHATKSAVHTVLTERPQIISWAVQKILNQSERLIPDLWSKSVNWDHKKVQAAYGVIDQSEGMPRVFRWLLRRTFNKIDLPRILELELRGKDSSYDRNEIVQAIDRRVSTAIRENFEPGLGPIVIVYVCHIIAAAVCYWLLG